ncbi:aldehyde dehydrogenase family protein [Micrococcus luteus]|uniref:Phenylacetaldehyde dehydrogenase n=2 Tax=Bacteria TaxID=2 RepID=A0ABD7M9T7_MICLU|nr:aldehyde dehydrogenase family protein [Micrococcus luteus]MDK7870240.1 aldehyde dehydrogenase family protein [Micrococcus luteus]MDK8526017.1 aldehyde dehydrogenase family protein [Micrococcus luteus]MDK8728415.1 aldehyde dehydrogenase family protein [Micrococcus luteus]PEH51442.1 aldehyde dehydrogenase [Micrococcus luteus]SHL72079.1 phenylacetaldehyde dehydrogenase [Micrococcus luteus]
MTETLTYADLLAAVAAPEGAGAEIKDPATGELIGHAPQSTTADLDAAVERARTAQRDWAKLPHAERSAALNRAADAIEASAEALAELLSREQGKPVKNGPNAAFEVGGCVAWTRATAAFEIEPEVLVDDESGRAELHWAPIGVVGGIGPWNWPMMISVWQIAPALRMGNTVVLKPSEYTPLSVLALAHVMNQALPEGVLQVLAGDGELGRAFTAHGGIDKITFTGSTATGKAIMKGAADDLKRITLELGGNDAGIVLDDADPKAIAEGLFWGAFINTGQTCAALKRLYVPDALYDAVCEELVAVARAMPMGNGLEEQNVLGPLQNKAQYDIVARLVQAAKDGGARVLLGGDPDGSAPGYFYPTTLVADIDNDNPLVAEEQFGPALPIVRYTDLEQAIAWANGLEVGLGASVWSPDVERAKEVALRLEAGSVWINKHGAIDPRVPFGGVKQSGMGREFGELGLKEMAEAKSISV